MATSRKSVLQHSGGRTAHLRPQPGDHISLERPKLTDTMIKNDTQPELRTPRPRWEQAAHAASAGLFLSSLMLLPKNSPVVVCYAATGIAVVSVTVAAVCFAHEALLKRRAGQAGLPLLAQRTDEPPRHPYRSHADGTTVRMMEF